MVADQKLVEVSVQAAEVFVSKYYAAYDSPQRAQLLPNLYRPTSAVVWNGNPIAGIPQLTAFLESMPATKHEVQTFDVHPLPAAGASGASTTPPSLMLSISGVVTHLTPHISKAYTVAAAAASAPSGEGRRGGGGGGRTAAERLEKELPENALPRTFQQSFVLIPDEQQVGQGAAPKGAGPGAATQYWVQADTMRFVG